VIFAQAIASVAMATLTLLEPEAAIFVPRRAALIDLRLLRRFPRLRASARVGI